MNDTNANAEVSSAWRKFIRDIFDDSSDPVKHCELYHNEDGKGSCPHVDGMLCDYPCDMLKRYRTTKASNPTDHGARSAPVHPVVGRIYESGEKP